MKQPYPQESLPQNAWIALGLLLLGLSLVVIPPVSRSFQPGPFSSFKDQIVEGMTITEVKEILGQPEKVEQLAKLVKVPIDFQLLDEDGNPIDQDHLAKAADGDQLHYFKIQRTTVVVRFGEDGRVKSFYQEFDVR